MNNKTSWENVSEWYDEIVGDKGHYYHSHIILPNVLRLLKLTPTTKVLDMGCGQGILGKSLPAHHLYWGLDASKNLIDRAAKEDPNKNHRYIVADATKEIKTEEKFDRIVFILSLQNMEKPFKVIQNCKNLLKSDGRIIIVLNHPAFRIPKHSNWNEQYRLIDSYMSPMEIPIDSSPFDRQNNQKTFSYHYPISAYSEMLFDNGMVVEKMEEWISDKKSTGSKAVIEDKARKEIPLFLTLVVKKI